jgi:hypothetical protein
MRNMVRIKKVGALKIGDLGIFIELKKRRLDAVILKLCDWDGLH